MAHYRIDLQPDDNDTFLVTCPALPEVTTFGDTEAEALEAAARAVGEAIAARLSDGKDIPAWGTVGRVGGYAVFLPALTALKVSLQRTLVDQGLTRAELARRLDWHREQVDRLFRLDHASRIDQLEAAFGALGHRVNLLVEAA